MINLERERRSRRDQSYSRRLAAARIALSLGSVVALGLLLTVREPSTQANTSSTPTPEALRTPTIEPISPSSDLRRARNAYQAYIPAIRYLVPPPSPSPTLQKGSYFDGR